jgi:DNA-binding NtrC family response regulator
MMTAKVLLVDDDPFTRQLFKGVARGRPIELRTAASTAEARREFHSTDFNLIILDQRLPDGNGLDLFAEMRSERPRQLAVLITGHADVRDALRAVREGLLVYLTKPFENLEGVDVVIDKALEMDRAYREIGDLRETLEARPDHPLLIGRSDAMERLLSQMRQVAPLDTTVIIEGESGTGKGLIARQIHAMSPRAGGPFIELNCGALPESVLEAALFGSETAAFASAAKPTPGYFEEADGGTLLLDEIADMSPKLQASLLRVLAERTFARLGSVVQRTSNFRPLCTTNKSLDAEMKAGRFRSDLYYRIKVVIMRVSPLRERRDDTLSLALFFLDDLNRKFGKTAGPFTPEAIHALETARWPGNVRELRHAVERAVVVSANRPIVPADLGIAGSSQDASSQAAVMKQPLPFRAARERFEREYFANLLHSVGGNMSEAARRSGMARQNLYAYFQRLGIVAKQ